MANAVVIQMAVRGAEQAISAMNRVSQQAMSLQQSIELNRKAFFAVGGATAGFAAAAVTSYESIERLRRVLMATVGDRAGAQLAEQIKRVAEEAQSSGAMLRQFAQNWVGMVQGGEQSVIRMMRALDRMGAGLTGADRERAAFQLAQIGALPTVQWEDLKQLMQVGMPMAGTARRLGLSTIRDAAGMDSRAFLEAFMAEAESRPAPPPLPTTSLANALERFYNALAPTGQRLAEALIPLVDAANRMLDWFTKFNSDGAAGLRLVAAGAMSSAAHLAAFGLAVQAATLQLSQMGAGALAAEAAGRGLAASSGSAAMALTKFALGLDAAVIGWQIGSAVSDWLDKQAQSTGYDNAGDWWARNNIFSPESYAIRERERIANAAASRENAIAMGYSESDADKVAGVVSRMQGGRKAHKRSDLQNMSANVVASAARGF